MSSLRCIQVIAGVLGRAGQSGQNKRLEAAKHGEVTWLPPKDLGPPKVYEQNTDDAPLATKPKIELDEDEEEHTRRTRSRRGAIDPEDDL
jgi:small subunit ribosomal protein S2